MANKMTKKDWFNIVISLAEGKLELKEDVKTGLVDFAKHEVELLDKKKGSGSQTKTQKENVGLMETMVKALAKEANPVTISEFLNKHKEELIVPSTGLVMTNQKCSALMKKLIEEGKVVKTTEKRESRFNIAG